jgi:hypothetical protein
VPVTELPPTTRFSHAEFKFNVRGPGEVDEELPPPHATSVTVEAEHKAINAKFFIGMRYLYRIILNFGMKGLFLNKILVHI